MQRFWQDLRHAFRMLLKRPGFSLLAALTLALGIGANTAIFSVVNAALWRPLPFPEADRLLVIQQTRLGEKEEERGVAYLNFLDWQAESRSFESLAIVGTDEATLTGEGEPARVRSAVVSADFFRTLKVQPLLGETFSAQDDLPNAREGQSA